MFGARKKFVEFVEVADNDFPDESMYYNQPSMFPHRSDKDVSFGPAPRALCCARPSNPDSAFETSSSDAFLSLAVVVKSAVAAWCKFVRSTK